MPGDVKSMAVFFEEKDKFTKVLVASNPNEDKTLPATKLTYFDLPPNIQVGTYGIGISGIIHLTCSYQTENMHITYLCHSE